MTTFTVCRWAPFVEFFDQIDQTVAKLVDGQREVKLQFHVVAGWYVSVTIPDILASIFQSFIV
jgi:hypothetical protein